MLTFTSPVFVKMPLLASQNRLTFGIEMELTLRPKILKGHSGAEEVLLETHTWANVAENLARNLQQKKILVSWSESPVNLDYKKWNIVPEDTIKSTPGYCKRSFGNL